MNPYRCDPCGEIADLTSRLDKALAEVERMKDAYVVSQDRAHYAELQKDELLEVVRLCTKWVGKVPQLSDEYLEERTAIKRAMDVLSGHFAEKPKEGWPIMHVPGCNVQPCNCKPVFGERPVDEVCFCAKIPGNLCTPCIRRLDAVRRDTEKPLCTRCGAKLDDHSASWENRGVKLSCPSYIEKRVEQPPKNADELETKKFTRDRDCTCGMKTFMRSLHKVGCPVRH